ncbi:MAG: four helix bundle protein [Muribaculaceae bacterium]|nr:four helix bundle protein [Muribaculaceae bacterium]
MKEDKDNLITIESKAFAIRCIRLYQHLSNSKKEFVLCKQLLRSGTSIGANVKEALRGQSRADFGAKMNIALKEANESEYWLELLFETGYISNDGFQSMIDDCKRLIRLLTSIVKTTLKKT